MLKWFLMVDSVVSFLFCLSDIIFSLPPSPPPSPTPSLTPLPLSLRHLGLDLVPRKDFETVDEEQISVSDLYKMVHKVLLTFTGRFLVSTVPELCVFSLQFQRISKPRETVAAVFSRNPGSCVGSHSVSHQFFFK